MLSQDLGQLAALVPQYLHHGEFELTAGGSVTWYIDGRELLLNDTGIKIAGRILHELLLPETESSRRPRHGGHHHREHCPVGRNLLGCSCVTTAKATACKSRSLAAASPGAK